jgi:hypothetical protein
MRNFSMGTNLNNFILGILTIKEKIKKKMIKVMLIDVTNLFFFYFCKFMCVHLNLCLYPLCLGKNTS